jgi:L-alanine-DL-glutamate epimerase-like enolase superfamily enzyme
MKTLALAEIMNIPYMVHSAIEAGICTAASVHLIAAKYNHFDYLAEITGLHGFESETVKNPLKIKGGFAEVPKGPRFGVELDEQAIKKYKKESSAIK